MHSVTEPRSWINKLNSASLTLISIEEAVSVNKFKQYTRDVKLIWKSYDVLVNNDYCRNIVDANKTFACKTLTSSVKNKIPAFETLTLHDWFSGSFQSIEIRAFAIDFGESEVQENINSFM